MAETFLTDKIIAHYKNPTNYGKLSGATHTGKYSNTYCGDEILVYGVIKNNVLEEIKFEGTGCSLCIASMSLFSEQLKGKKITEIEKITEDEVLVLTGTQRGSKRETCSLIGFYAVQRLISPPDVIIQ